MRVLRTFLLGALLSLTACTPPARTADDARSGTRIVVITHGQSADPFWSVVANGAHDAGRELGVRVETHAPPRFDMVEMSNLIDAAVASRPAGLVVSIPDGVALAPAIRAAAQAGIPIVSMNSGDDVYRQLGVLAHVGQTEYDAGFGAGERLGADGVTLALCVNHELGNLSLDRRCAGFADGLAPAGGRARVIAVNLADPDDAQQRIAGALAADPAIDGLLTLGPAATGPAFAALEQTGRTGSVEWGTFDLTPAVLEAVRDGRIRFAIDQQQYLQGYLPVVLLVKFLETGTMPGGGHVIATGPGFVTRENAAAVIDFARAGLR